VTLTVIPKENTRTYRLCLVKFSFIYLLSLRRELCVCTMLYSKYVVFKEMAEMAVHHLFIFSFILIP
jgi:hypothetical protein